MSTTLPITQPRTGSLLAPLAAVKTWLNITNTNSDANLTRLLAASSQQIRTYCNRSQMGFGPVSETRRGTGGQLLYLRQYPVLSVTSLTILNQPVAAQVNPPFGQGFVLDPWDGSDDSGAQGLRMYGGIGIGRFGSFPLSDASTVIDYVAGWGINEAQTIPATPGPYTIAVGALSRPWVADMGVVYASNGDTFIKATSPSGLTIGEYYVDATGNYTFAAADQAAHIGIQYGYVPEDLQQAVIQMVGEVSVQNTRIGVNSKSLGGQETVSFTNTAMSAMVKSWLNSYVCKVPMP